MLCLGLLALVAGCHPTDSPASAASAMAPKFNTDITVAELMSAVVMRQADVIWGAVSYGDVSAEGPDSDDGWLAVRDATLTMAEVTNSLMIPGRHAAPAGTEAGEGELTPAEIDALIDSNRGAWDGFALALLANAQDTIEAIDHRDADAMLDLGGTLDEICEACHKTFWYPNQ